MQTSIFTFKYIQPQSKLESNKENQRPKLNAVHKFGAKNFNHTKKWWCVLAVFVRTKARWAFCMQVTQPANVCVLKDCSKDHHTVDASGSDKADGLKQAATCAKWTKHSSWRKVLDLLDTNSPSRCLCMWCWWFFWRYICDCYCCQFFVLLQLE